MPKRVRALLKNGVTMLNIDFQACQSYKNTWETL